MSSSGTTAPMNLHVAIGRIRSQFEIVAWSPDGQFIAAAGNDGVGWCDRATGTQLVLLEGHSGPISSLAWSPDGKTIASGSDDNTVRLWDAATGRALRTLEDHSEAVSSVVWS